MLLTTVVTSHTCRLKFFNENLNVQILSHTSHIPSAQWPHVAFTDLTEPHSEHFCVAESSIVDGDIVTE